MWAQGRGMLGPSPLAGPPIPPSPPGPPGPPSPPNPPSPEGPPMLPSKPEPIPPKGSPLLPIPEKPKPRKFFWSPKAVSLGMVLALATTARARNTKMHHLAMSLFFLVSTQHDTTLVFLTVVFVSWCSFPCGKRVLGILLFIVEKVTTM